METVLQEYGTLWRGTLATDGKGKITIEFPALLSKAAYEDDDPEDCDHRVYRLAYRTEGWAQRTVARVAHFTTDAALIKLGFTSN